MADLLTSSYDAARRLDDCALIRRVREAERLGDSGELERLRSVHAGTEWRWILCQRSLDRLAAQAKR
jgi:hypothetical protein